MHRTWSGRQTGAYMRPVRAHRQGEVGDPASPAASLLGYDGSAFVLPPVRASAVLTGTNLVYTKKYNLRIVHEVIRVYGPLSRADVARHTQLSVQTVSNLVKELLELRLVQEGGRRSEGRGAPSTELTINPDGAYAIGLDLDRDHLTGSARRPRRPGAPARAPRGRVAVAHARCSTS